MSKTRWPFLIYARENWVDTSMIKSQTVNGMTKLTGKTSMFNSNLLPLSHRPP